MKARENPFRAEKVISLEFEPQGTSMNELWQKLEAMNWRGALVGPCGTGKTTLLETVQSRLEAEGRTVTLLTFNTRQRQLVLPVDSDSSALLVDGVEQLSRFDCWKLAKFGCRFKIFIVTSHRPTFLPTWLQTQTSPRLLQELCAHLNAEITLEDATKLWEKHGGNLRFALGELYDKQGIEKKVLDQLK